MAVSNFNRWRTALVAALAVALPFTATACAADEGNEQNPTITEDENEQDGENGEGENGEGENGEDGQNGNGGQSG